MKAVILAAGIGSRIRPLANGKPKCLLQFGDRTIMDCQIDSLFEAGISELAIVVGYGKDHIMEHIADRHHEKHGSIRFIVNPKFATTNNIYSLWLAREWLRHSDFICLNADVLFHPRIIVPAIATRAEISVIIDEEYRDETMKVIIRNGKVLAMSKAIPRHESSGTYVNITTFSRRSCASFFEAMEEVIREGRVNEFFNVAVERLIARGSSVRFTTTEGLPWAEIDDPNDLRYAQRQVYPQLIEDLAANSCSTAELSPPNRAVSVSL